MAAPEQRKIDWSSAEIEDTALRITLTGKSSKVFRQRFESVLALLGTTHGRWGDTRSTKDGIEVSDVQPGAETELRHFLESVVLEVNSELPEPERDAGDDDAQIEEAARADRQMTTAFRAFSED
jgi:hypothetical protein